MRDGISPPSTWAYPRIRNKAESALRRPRNREDSGASGLKTYNARLDWPDSEGLDLLCAVQTSSKTPLFSMRFSDNALVRRRLPATPQVLKCKFTVKAIRPFPLFRTLFADAGRRIDFLAGGGENQTEVTWDHLMMIRPTPGPIYDTSFGNSKRSSIEA
ncbi:hypothetical protein EDD17DRAFT_1505341 [Pisolithus thermaeus]|nr:hypothetical protein EDD17DRAFT_1505341 [Pisolithus thermaeus]